MPRAAGKKKCACCGCNCCGCTCNEWDVEVANLEYYELSRFLGGTDYGLDPVGWPVTFSTAGVPDNDTFTLPRITPPSSPDGWLGPAAGLPGNVGGGCLFMQDFETTLSFQFENPPGEPFYFWYIRKVQLYWICGAVGYSDCTPFLGWGAMSHPGTDGIRYPTLPWRGIESPSEGCTVYNGDTASMYPWTPKSLLWGVNFGSFFAAMVANVTIRCADSPGLMARSASPTCYDLDAPLTALQAQSLGLDAQKQWYACTSGEYLAHCPGCGLHPPA